MERARQIVGPSQEDTEKTSNIAHRGARSVAPENTLKAGRKAYESGADAWEYDVQLTSDKKFVVFHDETLRRTTDAEKVFPNRTDYRVKNFELSEIKKLDAGSWFEREDPFDRIARGKVSSEDLKNYRGIRVPSLQEALELTNELDWRANIEIKLPESQILPVEKPIGDVLCRFVDRLDGLDMMNDVVVSSFNHGIIRELTNLEPAITGALLTGGPITRPVEYLKVNNVKIYNLRSSALETNQGLRNVKKINEAGCGYRVNVWTINEKRKMEKLLANPYIDGLITDFPGRLSRMLDR